MENKFKFNVYPLSEDDGGGFYAEVPELPAGLRVVGADAAAHGILAAREARDDLAVVVERRGRDAVALRGIGRQDVPEHLARRLIERDEPAEALH